MLSRGFGELGLAHYLCFGVEGCLHGVGGGAGLDATFHMACFGGVAFLWFREQGLMHFFMWGILGQEVAFSRFGGLYLEHLFLWRVFGSGYLLGV